MARLITIVAGLSIFRAISRNMARPLTIVTRVVAFRRFRASASDVAHFAAFVAGRIVRALLAIFREMSLAVASGNQT